MNTYIPKKLNLEEHLKLYPPNEIEGFHLETGDVSPYWKMQNILAAEAFLRDLGYKRHNPNERDPN